MPQERELMTHLHKHITDPADVAIYKNVLAARLRRPDYAGRTFSQYELTVDTTNFPDDQDIWGPFEEIVNFGFAVNITVEVTAGETPQDRFRRLAEERERNAHA